MRWWEVMSISAEIFPLFINNCTVLSKAQNFIHWKASHHKSIKITHRYVYVTCFFHLFLVLLHIVFGITLDIGKKYSCWGPKRSTNLLNIPPGSVPSFAKNTDNWLTWSSSPDPQRNYSPLLIRKLTTDIMKHTLT